MCSTQEGLVLMQPRKKGISKTCMKCDSRAVVVVRGHDPLCRACFKVYVTHKFRSTLGKSKIVRQDEKVLVAFSGSASSSCLLQLVKEGLQEHVHKKLRFTPTVVHIVEDVNLGDENQQTEIENNLEVIKRIISETKFDVHIVSLREALGGSNDRTHSSPQSELTGVDKGDLSSAMSPSQMQDFEQRLKDAKSMTAVEDLMHTMRFQILISLARRRGYTKILTGESSTQLSIRVLSDIALGKGAFIPFEIGVADTRIFDVTIVRPMREISSKEIAFYNFFQDVKTVTSRSLPGKLSSKLSLQRQTEYFINELQVNFPSTVNTVFRTGDKLKISENLEVADNSCALCKAPVSVVEKGYCNEFHPEINDSRQFYETDRLHINSRTLCYGCLVTVKEMDLEKLPSPSLELVASEREKLREHIEEFLLE